jgi:hypothetical protein
MSVGVPTGTTITFATSGFTANIINSIQWTGISRPVIETTHFGSTQATTRQIGGRTFIPGKLTDPGTLEIEVQYDPTAEIPVRRDAETITIQPPTGQASGTISGTGFVSQVSIGEPLDGLPTAQLTIKWSGLVSTPSS